MGYNNPSFTQSSIYGVVIIKKKNRASKSCMKIIVLQLCHVSYRHATDNDSNSFLKKKKTFHTVFRRHGNCVNYFCGF